MAALAPEHNSSSTPKSSAAETLGERVRSLRLEMGVSQETLAELANVHWTFIGQVERGLRNITLHNLIRLADALGADPGVLVSRIGADQLPETVTRESKADAIRRDRAANRRQTP